MMRHYYTANLVLNGLASRRAEVIAGAAGHSVGTITMKGALDNGAHQGESYAAAQNTAHALNYGGRSVGGGGERVSLHAIDEMDWVQTNVSLLKVDVEGSEPLVVYGARRTIRRWRPTIYFERAVRLGPEALAALQLPARVLKFDLIGWVVSLNYSCTRVHPNSYRLLPVERVIPNDPLALPGASPEGSCNRDRYTVS
eukprot:3167310-Prymnesium_polylepis.1